MSLKIFTHFLLGLCKWTHSVHARVLKPWRGSLPWLHAVSSFCHVFPLPLSGLNWRSLSPLGDPVPLPPKWRPSSQGPHTLPYWDPEQFKPVSKQNGYISSQYANKKVIFIFSINKKVVQPIFKQVIFLANISLSSNIKLTKVIFLKKRLNKGFISSQYWNNEFNICSQYLNNKVIFWVNI